ncbi:hypothetical protein D3C84_689340 [compost metagenome]
MICISCGETAVVDVAQGDLSPGAPAPDNVMRMRRRLHEAASGHADRDPIRYKTIAVAAFLDIGVVLQHFPWRVIID